MQPDSMKTRRQPKTVCGLQHFLMNGIHSAYFPPERTNYTREKKGRNENMGVFGRKGPYIPPHKRREPEINLPLCLTSVEQAFQNCVDFSKKEILVGAGFVRGTLCWIEGMVRQERVSEYLICPLSRMPMPPQGTLGSWILSGGVWSLSAQRAEDMDSLCRKLTEGWVALFCEGEALIFSLATEEKRSIEKPEEETSIKGAKESFVESLRTNTSLVRRRLRTPFLRIEEEIVGRQSQTPVDFLWVDGITNIHLVDRIRARLAHIDIDAVLAAGNIEEYITDSQSSAFPQILFTERPDRLCEGLMEGRAAVLIDGLPGGYLLPGNISQFLRTPQDKSYNYVTVSALNVIRWMCLLITLFLPGTYVAMATFHFEMIPTKLVRSIIASKQDVPFSTVWEVLGLLLAFEVLQEAGLRLPQNIGQTVSIIGGLVVGQSAVEAKILSPVVIIVVAMAGIAGYTMPNQDFANALRVWRFLLTVAAALAGLFGMMAAALALAIHLSGLESFGVAYLTPFAANPGEQGEGWDILRPPLRQNKLRALYLHPTNRRNQG